MRKFRSFLFIVLSVFTFSFAAQAQIGIQGATLTDEGGPSYGLPANVVVSTVNNTSLAPYTYTVAGQTHTFTSFNIALKRFDFSYTYPPFNATSTFTIFKSDADSWTLNTYYTTGVAAGGAKLSIRRTGTDTYSFFISQVAL